jgi:hypothetical protein
MNYSNLLFTFLIICTLAIGCKKDQCDTDQGSTIFALQFSPRTFSNSEEQYLQVDFATSDLSAIPEVRINDTVMKYFNVVNGLHGSMLIPYSKSIEYSISANSKTSSGRINIPEQASTIGCNGDPLLPVMYSPVNYDSALLFSWQPAQCDYQVFDFSDDFTNLYEFIDGETSSFPVKTLPSSESNYGSIMIKSCNGDKLEPGNKPGVYGDYGYGYVMASNDISINLEILPGKKAVKLSKTPGPRYMNTSQTFLRKFNKITHH